MDIYTQNYDAYVAEPHFSDIQDEAWDRGYRKASADEIRASADSAWHAQDIYCWRCGLWVRRAPIEKMK